MRFSKGILVVFCLLILSGSLLVAYIGTVPRPMDDHFLYQRFAESFASGKLDLTVPGFHGADLLVVPVYWLTRSPIAQITTQILMSLLLPFLGYAAGRSVYRTSGISREGMLLAAIVTLMPFISFVGLRGWNGASYWSLMLGSIALAPSLPLAAGIVWSLAVLTKPFAIALLPLLCVLARQKNKSRSAMLLLWGLLPIVLYLILQWFQAGRIFVGAHAELTPGSALQHPFRIFLNAAHTLQILFSVHNYYFPDPALTGPGNMMHTTPLLTVLGLFGLLAPKEFYRDKLLPIALLGGSIIAFGMNTLLDHMDHFYMETGILLLIIASLSVLLRYRLWIPLVLATLHFQWFYFFLQYAPLFGLQWNFFAPLLITDILFIALCCASWRSIRRAMASVL